MAGWTSCSATASSGTRSPPSTRRTRTGAARSTGSCATSAARGSCSSSPSSSGPPPRPSRPRTPAGASTCEDRPLYVQEGNLVTERSVSPGGLRPVPDRRVRGLGAPRRRRGVRADVRRRAGELVRRAAGRCASTPRRAGWRSRWSTPATCTRATTSWSPRYKLGNIREHRMIDLIVLPQQTEFGLAKRDTLPRYCLECDVRFACHGGCPKDRFTTDPRRRARPALPVPELQGVLRPHPPGHGCDVRAAAGRPGAGRDGRRLRRGGRQAWPQRTVHLRLRPQVEGLPRHLTQLEAGRRAAWACLTFEELDLAVSP